MCRPGDGASQKMFTMYLANFSNRMHMIMFTSMLATEKKYSITPDGSQNTPTVQVQCRLFCFE